MEDTPQASQLLDEPDSFIRRFAQDLDDRATTLVAQRDQIDAELRQVRAARRVLKLDREQQHGPR